MIRPAVHNPVFIAVTADISAQDPRIDKITYTALHAQYNLGHVMNLFGPKSLKKLQF